MKKTTGVAVASCLLAAGLAASPQETKAPTAAAPHVLIPAAEIRWSPQPPFLPKGGEMMVLSGDPGKPAPYVIRVRIPAGYKVAPHWHPSDEHLTVLSGTLSFGMGDTFDSKTMKPLGPGGYALMPADMRHYVWTKAGATFQVHGTGPFVITYVNPADDPRTAQPATP